MRIVFMGTPAFARDVLDALLAAPEHEVIAAYTQPPRPGGRRGRDVVKSPVQVRAEGSGIPVYYPASLKDAHAQAAFAALGADVAVVAAYGLILPRAVLDAPRLGCLNVHASLLPRWRGAAPVQRAILAGDAETGVCIMQMEAGLDTGPVLHRGVVPIGGMTAGDLTDALATLGGQLMVAVLRDPSAWPAVAQPADGVTYAHKIAKDEARLDFTQDAAAVVRQVQAFNPPGAWFEIAGERVRVFSATYTPPAKAGAQLHAALEDSKPVATGPRPSPGGMKGEVLDDALTIACGTGAIRPTSVQRAGRQAMSVAELLRGFPIPPGTRL